MKGLFSGQVTGVPQVLMLEIHVPSPGQNLKPSGHFIACGQLVIDFLQELSTAHFTGLSAGQYD
jgi:hypothetical protein